MNIEEKQATWNQERPLFEADFIHSHLLPFFNFNENTGDYEIKSEFAEDEDHKVAFETLNTGWVMWLRAKHGAVPEGFVLVEKKNIEHWYLDESENMWWEQTDWLCDLSIGEVEEVEHKQYLITEQSKKYAAITWDEANDDVGYYELFDTREEAEQAAAYCKAKVKAQGEKE